MVKSFLCVCGFVFEFALLGWFLFCFIWGGEGVGWGGVAIWVRTFISLLKLLSSDSCSLSFMLPGFVWLGNTKSKHTVLEGVRWTSLESWYWPQLLSCSLRSTVLLFLIIFNCCLNPRPAFLPDPNDGSLYTLGGKNNEGLTVSVSFGDSLTLLRAVPVRLTQTISLWRNFLLPQQRWFLLFSGVVAVFWKTWITAKPNVCHMCEFLGWSYSHVLLLLLLLSSNMLSENGTFPPSLWPSGNPCHLKIPTADVFVLSTRPV